MKRHVYKGDASDTGIEVKVVGADGCTAQVHWKFASLTRKSRVVCSPAGYFCVPTYRLPESREITIRLDANDAAKDDYYIDDFCGRLDHFIGESDAAFVPVTLVDDTGPYPIYRFSAPATEVWSGRSIELHLDVSAVREFVRYTSGCAMVPWWLVKSQNLEVVETHRFAKTVAFEISAIRSQLGAMVAWLRGKQS